MISAPANFTTANAELAKRPIYIIAISGYYRTFTNCDTGIPGQYDWLESYSDLSITISELDGGSDIGGWNFTVSDGDISNPNAITADFPSFVFEGKAITVKTGFVGMSQADFALLYTGDIDTVVSANDNLSYTFNCIDNQQKLTSLLYTVADDGNPTSSDHMRTLNGHPLDLLISALAQIGYEPSMVNQTKILGYRNGLLSGIQFQFDIDSPPQAKEFLEAQILKPLAGYMWTNNLGQVDVNFLRKDVRGPYPSQLSLNEDNMISVPLAQQVDMVNVINFRMDKSKGGSTDYAVERISQYNPSISLYGQFGQQTIEAAGMRSGLQGVFLAHRISRSIFKRVGLKNLTFIADLLWSACCLEPGDIVDVSSPHVPDRIAGTMGISGKLFEVFDRRLNFNDGIVTVRLLDASYLSQPLYFVAGNSVPAFASASGTEKAKYMFQANDSDQYSDASAAHGLF